MQITSTNSSTSNTQEFASSQRNEEGKVTKISFSVSKKEHIKIVDRNKLSGGRAENEEDEVESKKRGISHFEDGHIVDYAPDRKKQKKVFVIPHLQLSNQAQIERLTKLVSEGNATEYDKARLALLNESSSGIDDIQTVGTQQKQQIGLQSMSGMPITIEPDEVDPDYDTMPVGEFGLAFLRGCGWKDESSAIGRTNAQAVQLQVTKPRPKGLGLGATLPAEAPTDKKKETANGALQQDDQQTMQLSKDSFVKCLGGLYKGQYGQVLSMDEENSSIFLELTWPSHKAGRTVRVSQFAVEVISKAEYRKKVDQGGNDQSKNGRTTMGNHGRRKKINNFH